MCGRYTVVSKIETIEKKFGVRNTTKDASTPIVNLGVGMKGPVITGEQKDVLNWFEFGLTPAWADKKKYFFNARSEGDQNREDSVDYHGRMGIFEKPAFRQAIRNRRCLVIADGFFEGSKSSGLSKPYFVFLRNSARPFAMAGIWDEWTNNLTGEISRSYSILTTPANALLREIGHPRCPVILESGTENEWLRNDLNMGEIASFLHTPDPLLMNAYPVSPDVKNVKNQDIGLLQPTGDRLMKEWTLDISHELKLYGMGESASRARKISKSDSSNQLNLFD